jgi:hypothetical protein
MQIRPHHTTARQRAGKGWRQNDAEEESPDNCAPSFCPIDFCVVGIHLHARFPDKNLKY